MLQLHDRPPGCAGRTSGSPAAGPIVCRRVPPRPATAATRHAPTRRSSPQVPTVARPSVGRGGGRQSAPFRATIEGTDGRTTAVRSTSRRDHRQPPSLPAAPRAHQRTSAVRRHRRPTPGDPGVRVHSSEETRMAAGPPVQPAESLPRRPRSEAAARGAAGLRGRPTPSEVIAGLRATSHGEDLVQLLSPEGTLTPHPDFPIEVDADLLRGLYRDMVLVRRFDREGNALQRQGQLNIWVPLLGQEAAQIGAGRAMRPERHGLPVLPRARRRLVPRRRPDPAARHLPRHRPVRLGPEGHPVQQLHDRHRQPGAQRHRVRDGPAARRRGRRVPRTEGEDRERGHHRLLRRRRDQPGRRARGHGVRRGVRRARGLLLPEQPVGDLRAGGQAVAGAALGAVDRLRLPRRPGRRQRRAGLPGGDPVGAGGVPVGQRAR